ncbi:MAG: hypothetical protein J0M20_01700 [Burkholderiales bacterium]|nr:hypothetical protein [Burkholderiales bacterium]
MDAPALSARHRPRPDWRWTRPFALLPLLAGVGLACGVLQLALRCCS